MTPQGTDLAAEWRTARLLYPLYAALAREFVLDLPVCSDLESGVDAPPQESVELARQCLLDMDEHIQVHQLRQFLQTTPLCRDEALRALLEHHLHKEKRSPADRDKIDFLLVQFFSHCAPSRLEDADVDMDYVAQVLEPALGAYDPSVPPWLKPLDEILETAQHARDLNQLLSSGILEKGRKLKVGCGENYFQPTAMVAFTRFSFLMRRVFFRLLHQDLNAILDGLHQLEQRSIYSLDCRRAQFSADEPTARLRMICHSWKVMFHAEYSSGQPLRMLVDLRAAVDAALMRSTKTSAGKTNESSAPRTLAAAASTKSAGHASPAPAFEVPPSPDWQTDASPGDEKD